MFFKYPTFENLIKDFFASNLYRDQKKSKIQFINQFVNWVPTRIVVPKN